MIFLILIVQAKGIWEIYFSAFHQATHVYCNNNACPFSFKQNLTQVGALYSNCTNPLGAALVLGSSQMTSVLNQESNSLKTSGRIHTLTLDLYFLSQWDNDEFNIEYKSQIYQFKYSTQNPLQFSTGACNSSFHSVRTIQIVLQDVTSLTNLKFSILNQQTKALIRNVHLSYIKCHPTCYTCNGEGYNKCTSCFAFANLVNGECRCPIRTVLTGEVNYYRCLNFCLLGQTDGRGRLCKGYEIRFIVSLVLFSYSYPSLINWRIIYDPQNLSNQNKKLGPYFGIFKNNEGASYSVSYSNFIYPLGVQMFILMCNATPANSGISIYINSTYQASFYFDGVGFQTDNLYIYAYNRDGYAGCSTVIRFVLYANLYIQQGNFVFSLKGNFTDSNSGWYIIYTQLAGVKCPAACLKCERDYDCAICQSGYKKVSDGRCVLSCPKDSVFTNNKCIKYDETTKYSQYFIKLFLDFTVPNNIKDMFILESSTISDFQKGDFIYWSYIESKAVFGGKYVWATAKFSQKYTILKPHHSLTIYFDAIFGCNFQNGAGYLGYSVNNNTENQVNQNKTITIHVSNYSPTLFIAFQCHGLTNNVLDSYCALSDFLIVVHYCKPFCLECTDEDTCTSMFTYDNSIIKLDQSECGPQQFLDPQYFKCEQCPPECEDCFNEYECTKCNHPYKLYITKCLLMCELNQYFNELTNMCEDCSFKCKQCRNNKDRCIHCEEQNFRLLNLNKCICYSGYYDDNATPACKVCHQFCRKCYGPSNKECTQCNQIDNIEMKGDACDCKDGYYFDEINFKCTECNRKCKTCISQFENSCLSCDNDENRILYGIQCICQIGYFELVDFCQVCPAFEDSVLQQCYKKCGDGTLKWHNQPCDLITCLTGFDNVNNQCIPICGDLLVNGDEECEDGNLEINDGCVNCKFYCPKQCITCNSLTTFPCQDICGDGITSGFEECDDGNNIQFDGCFQCKKECQIQCTRCMRGECYECLTYGWNENIETLQCIEICGDSIIIGREECDDGYNLEQNDGCYQCKRLCRNDCKTCSSDGKTCLDCQVIGFKPQNYFCVNICGDGYLANDPYGRNTEECDDFNLIGFDGCSNICKFQCQNDVCKVCQNGRCIECIDHYYLDVKINKCLEICHDNIIIGQEKCEDMNSLLYDGCYKCQLSCQPNCLICEITGCQQCQIGFRLVQNKCENICGDQLTVQGEDCDDGNINPFDGCHFCQIHCGPNCQICFSGRCLSCYQGFKMLNGLCVISYFKQVGVYTENSDINQNQISNSFISFCAFQINETCLICEDSYYFNIVNSECESQCGDNFINNLEQCESDLTQKEIVCTNCQFQCKDNCSECYFGLCQNCQQDYILIEQLNECTIKAQCNEVEGLYYDNINNQCYEICGDGIISINEECDDQNFEPFDGCFQCKFSCYSHCPLCIKGICTDDGTACQNGFYFDQQTGFCYSVCGDGIKALPDEECDELNNKRCQNCKLLTDKNCKILDETNQCVTCLDNFQIIDEICQPKTKQTCDIPNCISCENNICTQPPQIQVNNSTQKAVIQFYCGDGQINQNEFCDDGNQLDGDGCDSNCQPSKNSICQFNECIQVFYPCPFIKFVNQIQNYQILTLYYDQQVKLSANSTLEQYLNSLQGKVENTNVNISFDSKLQEPFDLTNLEISIKIEYLEKAIDPVFLLNFRDPSIIINELELEQQLQQITIQLASPNLLSTQEQKTTESIVKFNGYQIQIIAAVILASSITGKFQIIENQIEMIQMLYYYKYINIIKGQNLSKFFETFKIIQLANFFEQIGFQPELFFFSQITITESKSNSIFENDGRSSNFLCSFLQTFSIVAIAYFSHILVKIAVNLTRIKVKSKSSFRNSQYSLKLFNKLLKFCIKNNGNQFKTQFKIIFQSLIYEHVINTMISFQYQKFDDLNGKISLILNIILLVFLTFYLINQQNQKFNEIKYILSCVQKIIFCIILVGCCECPIVQIQLCAINELLYFSFLFIKRNKIKYKSTYKDQFIHLTFFLINQIYLIHEFYKRDPQVLVILGWIQIGIMSFNLSIILIFDLCSILQPILEKVGKVFERLQNYFKKKPLRKQANLRIFDNDEYKQQPQKIQRIFI